MTELQERLEHRGAYLRCGEAFCSVHGTKLTVKGECVDCTRTDMIVGAELAEARAMEASQKALEEDV